MSLSVDQFFATEGGLIAAVKPDFTTREGQAELSKLIMAAIASENHVIAEASTGFGKSFSILVPAIVQAVMHNKRIVISTETLTLQDQYCVAPESRVLTSDLRYIPASTVQQGMELIGFDEEAGDTANKKWRQFKTAKVLFVNRITRPCYKLTFDDGSIITSSKEHKWLCRRGTGQPHWMETERLYVQKGRGGSRVIKPFDTWETDNSWEGGYLSAAIAGEGHLSQHASNAFNGFTNALIFSQKQNDMMNRVKSILEAKNYRFTQDARRADCKQVRISPRHEMCRFLGSIRPERVLPQFRPDRLGSMWAKRSSRLIAKEYVGEQEVVAIETSTHTLIVEGFASHNCYTDLPLLQKACKRAGHDFHFAAAKGKNNFICRLRVFDDTQDKKQSPLRKWAQSLDITAGDTGDISDVPADAQYDPVEWLKINCDDQCTKKACPFYGAGANVERGETECFAYQARRNYAEAQIVVANHTLVLLDAQLGAGTLLGPYDVLIVDEAHSMPEKAQDAWGKSLKPTTVSKVIMTINRMMQRDHDKLDTTDVSVFSELEGALFSHFDPIVHKGNSTPMTKVPQNIVTAAKNSAAEIVVALKRVGTELSDKFRRLTGENLEEVEMGTVGSSLGGALVAAKESLSTLIGTVNSIFGDNLDPEYAANWLSFIEVSTNKHGKHAILNLKPIEVAPLMKVLLIDKIPTVVCLSATLKVNNSFHFCKKELGMPFDKTVEFTGESPFNFTGVTAYVPRDLPACEYGKDEVYLDSVAQECIRIIQKMGGRTMVLFTNAKHMKEVYNRVVANVPYQVYLQGQMSKNILLDTFRGEISSCLLATRSFFQGVDIPGESLSCVVLVKAPFRSPQEPMFEARCQRIKELGGSDFTDYALPLMLSDLRQAFGRLVRTTTDTGMFAFLDSRATGKSYWSNIRASLPQEMRYVKDLARYGVK
jgi:ATP-dependent DNA helicase DinG